MRFNDKILVATANDIPDLSSRMSVWNYFQRHECHNNSEERQQLETAGEIVSPCFSGLILNPGNGRDKTTCMVWSKQLKEQLVNFQHEDQRNSIPGVAWDEAISIYAAYTYIKNI